MLQAAKKLADALRAKRAYTNTATFDLKCQVCHVAVPHVVRLLTMELDMWEGSEGGEGGTGTCVGNRPCRIWRVLSHGMGCDSCFDVSRERGSRRRWCWLNMCVPSACAIASERTTQYLMMSFSLRLLTSSAFESVTTEQGGVRTTRPDSVIALAGQSLIVRRAHVIMYTCLVMDLNTWACNFGSPRNVSISPYHPCLPSSTATSRFGDHYGGSPRAKWGIGRCKEDQHPTL